MLRTSAAALIVTVLIAGPVVAQPSGGTDSTPKSTSMVKQTNTTKMEKNAGKPIVHRRPRHRVVYHRGSGRRHLVGPDRALSSREHAESNGSHKSSKIESNTHAQK
jgi:hypothetical protein